MMTLPAGVVDATLSDDQFANQGNAIPIDTINDTPVRLTPFDNNDVDESSGFTSIIKRNQEAINNLIDNTREEAKRIIAPNTPTQDQIRQMNLDEARNTPLPPETQDELINQQPQQETPSPVKKAKVVANLQTLLSNNTGRAKNKGKR